MKPAAKRLFGILGSTVLVVAAIVIYASMLVPQYQEIQELRGERSALSTVLAEEQEAVDAVQRLIRQYDNISDLRESLDVTLPSQEETASIVNQFQGIASSNGVLMDSLAVRPLAVEARNTDEFVVRPVGALRVSMNLIGSYQGLRAYLAALETNIRVMDVKFLRVNNDSLSSGPYEYEIEVDTYYQI